MLSNQWFYILFFRYIWWVCKEGCYSHQCFNFMKICSQIKQTIRWIISFTKENFKNINKLEILYLQYYSFEGKNCFVYYIYKTYGLLSEENYFSFFFLQKISTVKSLYVHWVLKSPPYESSPFMITSLLGHYIYETISKILSL